jgi:hypothetical protein
MLPECNVEVTTNVAYVESVMLLENTFPYFYIKIFWNM